MKYIFGALVMAGLLLSGTIFAKEIQKIATDIKLQDNVANLFIGVGDMKIYKYTDEKNTCYISYHEINRDNIRYFQHNLSCVKN